MAPAPLDNIVLDVASVKLFGPIFAGDNLPTNFSKRIRRPIVDVAEFNTTLTILNLALHGDYHPDEEGERNDLGFQDTASMDISCVNTPATHAHSILNTNAGAANKIRIVGGRAAVPKKISADLDSEDELIKQMKDNGESNETISARLIERQGTRYDPKTIATRYSRIKRMLHVSDEQRMDDEFSDYHDEEDTNLREAVQKTQDEFDKSVRDLEHKRWERVSSMMAVQLKKSKYSTKACRDRFESLQQGTAISTQEQDANPEKRAEEVAERVQERLRIKAEASEKAKREEAQKMRIKREEMTERFEECFKRQVKRAETKATRDAILAEKNAVRKAKELSREEAAAQKAAAEQAKRNAKEAADRKRRDQKAARAYEKEHARGTRAARALREKLDKVENQRKAQIEKLHELQEIAMAREVIRRTMRDAGVETRAPLEKAGMAARKPSSKENSTTVTGLKRTAAELDDSEEEEVQANSEQARKKFSGKSRAKNAAALHLSSTATSGSPRSSMNTHDLAELLKTRNMNASGSKEDLVRRLADDDMRRSKEELKQMVGAKHLKTTGSKAELAKRLAAHDAQASGH